MYFNLSISHVSLKKKKKTLCKGRVQFAPKATKGATKYGQAGNLSKESFRNLEASDNMKEQLANSANHAIARITWSTYSATRAL